MGIADMSFLVETASSLTRATIVECYDNGELMVQTQAENSIRLLCDFLQTSPLPGLALQPGDSVLVHMPGSLDSKGCVLGKVGPYRKPESVPATIPDRLILEANKEVVVRCGEGALTMREDGKVMLQGQDLVSHAKRCNRIKGGSVAIN